MIKRYDERVLNLLLDRYENSLSYTGENKRKQTIFVPISKKVFPEYYSESSMEYEVLHQQLLELEAKGYVELKWKQGKVGHILEKCSLILERADKVYELLNRNSKKQKNQDFYEISNKNLGKCRELDVFIRWLMERLQAGKSLGGYVALENLEDYQTICDSICAIASNKEEVFLREFSVRYLHDSKKAEKIINRAARILQEFSDNPNLQGLSLEEVLEEYNIYRNPTVILLKGIGSFQIGVGTDPIQLSYISGGIGITSKDIWQLKWDTEIMPKKIVTIENLTSFYRWNDEGSLAIYLGGYHNRIRRILLKNIYDTFRMSTAYYHFGDIDVGGFKIWKDLCLKTGIPFVPYQMDLESYLRYLPYGRELTERDRLELMELIKDDFFEKQKELFACMLLKNRKLEQECMIPAFDMEK